MARNKKAGEITAPHIQPTIQSVSNKVYIGIDNGTSGSVAAVGNDFDYVFMKTPVFMQQSYTKEKKNISRVDSVVLRRVLRRIARNRQVMAIIERPMVNPGRFAATLSACRALEATLVILEQLEIPHMYVDSKQWQKLFLPSSGKKKVNPDVLKQESKDIGMRLFPASKDIIMKQKDADGLLIAEWARRENL